MSFVNVRDVLAFPSNGDNASDTIINGKHFNTTALTHFNYTLYTNDTLSNISKCYLVYGSYQPSMLPNGTFLNATSCYDPVLPLRTRGAVSIALGIAFALSIMFTLVNLNKHGRLHIREDRRFRVVGRRWQWYWMLFTAACGTISCLTAVDVDRDYLQDIALVLQGFFYYLMVPTCLAVVWEATRHWGSWQERQIVDEGEHRLSEDGGRRERVEFWMPLVFYLFAWLNFFMIIPRSWSPVKKQHDPVQQQTIAEPLATDARFKAGSILAVCGVVTICASLRHSLKHYRLKKPGVLGDFLRNWQDIPAKLALAIIFVAARTGYGVVSSWRFDLNILKYDGQIGWPYGLGYGSTLAIIIVFNVFGLVEENEDIHLLKQRRARGRILDAELGLTKKPHWWTWGRHDLYMTDEQRLRALTTEVEQGAADKTPVGQSNVQYGDATELRDRSRNRPADDPFKDELNPSAGQSIRSMLDLDARPQSLRNDSQGGSIMSGTTLSSGGRPQKIRSMLDV